MWWNQGILLDAKSTQPSSWPLCTFLAEMYISLYAFAYEHAYPYKLTEGKLKRIGKLWHYLFSSSKPT